MSAALQDEPEADELAELPGPTSMTPSFTRTCTMRDHLTAVVEELAERKVVAFMSDSCIEPDLALESFVLEQEQ